MAALIDHKGASGDFNFIRAKVVDHLCTFHSGQQPAVGDSAHIHGTYARRSGVQHQQLAADLCGQFHGMSQDSPAVSLANSALPHDHQTTGLSGIGHSRGQCGAVGSGVGVVIG